MDAVQGIYAAAITPRGAQGDIDFGAAFELIDFLSRSGAQGIALFTAAGEYPAVPAGDRSRLAYLAVKRSRVPLLAGVGSATLDDSVALGREARDAGAAGLLLPPPYFFRYEQDDLREYYLQFAAHVEGVPIYLSHVAECATRIDAETAAELFASGKFAGMEEASGDSGAWGRLARRNGGRPGGPSYLVGHDGCLRAGLAAGAHGAVSPAACAIPELVLALARAIAAGNADEADGLEKNIAAFLEWVEQVPRPVILKVATGMRGLKTGPVTTPLCAEKARKVDAFREWFQGWMPAVTRRPANA
jgi:dihydrodipicolinate synthase/N-acetylneuraminate lyase